MASGLKHFLPYLLSLMDPPPSSSDCRCIRAWLALCLWVEPFQLQSIAVGPALQQLLSFNSSFYPILFPLLFPQMLSLKTLPNICLPWPVSSGTRAKTQSCLPKLQISSYGSPAASLTLAPSSLHGRTLKSNDPGAYNRMTIS